MGSEGTSARIVRLIDQSLATTCPTGFGNRFTVEATRNRC